MIEVTEGDKFTLVKVATEKLNNALAPDLKGHFVKLSSEGVKNIILDLSDTKFCDSSGLSAILVGNRVCKNAKGTFVVCGIHDMVEKLIKISQLDSILNLAPTVTEARDIVFMDEVERGFDETE